MYDVSHKKEKLSMCMYDVIVKKAKIMRQKHKNMFESAVLIVKRTKTRANARGALYTRRTRRTRLAESSGAWCMNGASMLLASMLLMTSVMMIKREITVVMTTVCKYWNLSMLPYPFLEYKNNFFVIHKKIWKKLLMRSCQK